jgi:hypothetical protein
LKKSRFRFKTAGEIENNAITRRSLRLDSFGAPLYQIGERTSEAL